MYCLSRDSQQEYNVKLLFYLDFGDKYKGLGII